MMKGSHGQINQLYGINCGAPQLMLYYSCNYCVCVCVLTVCVLLIRYELQTEFIMIIFSY